MRRHLVVPAVVSVALVAMGCDASGGGSSSGNAVGVASSVVAEPTFNPCAIPHDALRGVGVDPASAEPDFFGAKAQGWKLCRWSADAGWYFLGIASMTHGIDEVRTNPRNTDITPVQVGARPAFTYHETTDLDREWCDVAFGNERESVLVRVSTMYLIPALDDPCVVAVRTARGLDAVLPGS